ncbi:Hypothetical predicted protein [Paramuricea clavata]|uniref:Uncharacterized protein n=1 Tax=Paramuricea clavata TaxID=317549 RepID=A0A6S7J830_PARCT|nr:Hypothetical predicted protein [Paramuricea clavata]
MSQSIKLYNADGNAKLFHTSYGDLKNTDIYIKAEVISGKWILYRTADYNKSLQTGARPYEHVVLSTADKKVVDISDVNGSLFHVPSAVQALMLFEFNYYGGDNREYVEEHGDLEDFPKGARSSMVGKDNDWQVYPKAGDQGTPQKLTRGTDYQTTADMKVPVVKSIKPFT